MSEISEHLDAARERYLTKAEAARLARCSTKTLERAIHSGRLPAFKPTTRVLLREQDVRAWVESEAASAQPLPKPRRLRPQPGSLTALRELERQAAR